MESRLHGWIAASLCCACLAVPSVAQTVQLPSIQTFSYSGSVMVPDSGSTYLGGNQSHATSSSGRGNFAVSSGLTSSLSAHATIIDLEAMDREIRGLDDSNPLGGPNPRIDSNGRRIDPLEEAKSLVRQARKLRSDGHDSQSRAAYRMAIAKLDALARVPRAAVPGELNRPDEPDKPGELARDPRQLAILARSEFFTIYPDERFIATGTP